MKHDSFWSRGASLLKGAIVTGLLLGNWGCNSNSTGSSSSTGDSTTTTVVGFATPATKSLDSGNGGGTQGSLIAVADFNADGLRDVAVANPATHTISVFFNAGSGTLGSETKFNGPVSGPVGIAVGDFDKNGKVDLAVIGATQVSFLFNDGSGAFPNRNDIAVGNNNTYLSVVDVDQDGSLDVAVSDSAGSPLHVVFGDGTANTANYVVQDYTTTSGTVTAPLWLASGDFNADGLPDLAFATSGANYLTLWLNNAGARTNRFPSANTVNSGLSLASGYTANSLAVGDFDSDGRPDIFTPSFVGTTGVTRLFLNKSSGLTISNYGDHAMSNSPRAAAVADINQDGRLDAIAISSTGTNGTGTGEADIFFGDAQGNLTDQVAYAGATNQNQSSVVSADLDNDGLPDLVLVGPGNVTVLLNTTTRVTN